MLANQNKLNGPELLEFLGLLAAEEPASPEIYQLSFDHLSSVVVPPLLGADPDTDFRIANLGTQWGGYDTKEFDYLSGKKTNEGLTPEEDITYNAAFPYLKAVGDMLKGPLKTLSASLSHKPYEHKGWATINKAIKKTENTGLPEQAQSYEFIANVR